MAVYKRIRFLCLFLVALMLLNGCEKAQNDPQIQDLGGELVCMEYSSYTGSFPEDGTYRQVKNVAAMRVRNDSGKFLDRAVVKCTIGDQVGTFEITGLPPGGMCWVLEKNAMTVRPDDEFQAQPCEDFTFREDAVMRTDALSVQSSGNALKVTNTSRQTLQNVAIYYKDVHPDGNYFGGITYLLAFDTLAPGETAVKQTGHFGESSKVVRYSYQGIGQEQQDLTWLIYVAVGVAVLIAGAVVMIILKRRKR